MSHHKYTKYKEEEFPVEFAQMLKRERFKLALASVAIKRINQNLEGYEKILLIEIFGQFLKSLRESGRVYLGAKLNALAELKLELQKTA